MRYGSVSCGRHPPASTRSAEAARASLMVAAPGPPHSDIIRQKMPQAYDCYELACSFTLSHPVRHFPEHWHRLWQPGLRSTGRPMNYMKYQHKQVVGVSIPSADALVAAPSCSPQQSDGSAIRGVVRLTSGQALARTSRSPLPPLPPVLSPAFLPLGGHRSAPPHHAKRLTLAGPALQSP